MMDGMTMRRDHNSCGQGMPCEHLLLEGLKVTKGRDRRLRVYVRTMLA